MDEAKDYKAYLKALKKATQKPVKKIELTSDAESFLQRRKILSGVKKFSCGGMGIAIKGGDFKGVK
jgi:ribonuclease HI|tara:strand:- start:12 stop:209 length:198 start_codon:yes stop_codon:yes gene_type:complete